MRVTPSYVVASMCMFRVHRMINQTLSLEFAAFAHYIKHTVWRRENLAFAGFSVAL